MAADPSLMCKISCEEIKNFLRIPLGDIKKASLDFDQIPEDDKKANVINRMGILKKLKKTPFVLCMDELHLPYLKPEEVAERDDDDGPSTSKKAKVQVRSSILVVLFQSLDCKEMAVIDGKMLSKRDVYDSDLVLKVMIYMERYLRMANIEKNCVGFVLDNCNVNASARKLYKGAIPIVWDYLHFANVSVNTYGHIDRTLFETYNSEFLAGDYRETVESIYDKYAMPPNLIPQYMEEKEAILRILSRLFALRKPENQPQSRRITHISNYFIELLGKYILNTGHQYVEAAKAAFKSELFDEKI